MGLVCGLYLLDYSPVAPFLGNQFYTYLFKPILWLGVAYLICFILPHMRAKGPPRLRGFLNWWAFIFAFMLIVFCVTAGLLIDGLGSSPYNHSLKGILLNILLIGSVILATELVRHYLVNSMTSKENYLVFILIALFLTLLAFPLKKFFGFQGYQDAVKYMAQYVMPEFSKNLLATFLAYLGGPLPAIIYMGTLQAFKWFSPVLPNLQWITEAFVGVLCPVFCLIVLQGMYLKESRTGKKGGQNEENPAGWIGISLFSVILIWFVVGVFPIYPSVIATGSMEPGVRPGDVILVKKVKDMDDIHSLQPGEIIQFRRDNILICHRITAVAKNEDEQTRFHTRGDNNSAPDSQLVKPGDVKGRVVEVVPKLGWPTLLIKSQPDVPLDEIYF